MAEGRFISYLRVSTARQGASGLGLEAQRQAVAEYLNGGKWQLLAEVVEIESGKRNDRAKLAEAMKLCRLHGATLVIAKLDRLSRDAAFLLSLQASGLRFVCADMPQANELTVGILAVVAQAERNLISVRTKAALAVAKSRGKVLGGYRGTTPSQGAAVKGAASGKAKANARAADLSIYIAEIRAEGAVSLRDIAAGLNARGIPTAKGGTWSAVQVSRVIARQG